MLHWEERGSHCASRCVDPMAPLASVMRGRRLTFGFAGAALAAVVLLSCSDDEEGNTQNSPRGASAGQAGDVSVAGDGAASSGGTGDGGDAQGGSSSTPTAGNGAGGEGGIVDPGPSCTLRENVPAPIPRTVDVAAACSMPSTCGGDLEGTSWEVESACFELSTLFPLLTGICSTVDTYSVFQSQPSGTASFDASGGAITIDADISLSVDFPNECHFCQCSNLEDTLVGAGMDASCNPGCYNGTCFCTLNKTVSVSLSDAQTLPYCIADGALRVQDGSAVYTLRPPEELHTPEICDGLDNDGNSLADDELVECPTCSNVGACGQGVQATCSGASGWSCVYTSPDWEANETLCDAVDNDCDGELNEELDCKEFCDGKDNDGIGGVDDDPFGPPTCTDAGVCGAGYDADCNGAAGWRCQATSAAYETVETECDGLDNDCNGLEDERCCAAGSAKMYYAYIKLGAASAYVARANLNGTSPQNLVTVSPAKTLLDVALDPVGGKIYWANLQDSVIQRADPDGTNVESPLAASSQPRLALDVAHRAIYWAGPGSVKRSDLDNLADTVDVPGVPAPQTMTVDSQHGWLFTGGGNFVNRADFDGSNLISIGDVIPTPEIGQVIEGIAVDPVGNKLYWTSGGGIHRSNLDLTQPEKIFDVSDPHHLFIDTLARRFYWSETTTNRISRMDMDSMTPTYFAPTDAVSVRFGQVVPCPPP
jgi:hypothetical protein